MKNYLFSLFIFSILILGCVNIPGTGGPSVSDVTKLVPANADGYVIVQITKVLQDEDFKKSIKESSGKDVETELQNAVKETGIDPRTLQTLLMFFKSSEFNQAESYVGMIVKGSFNKDLIMSKVKEKQKENFKEETYEGVQIYTTVDKYERTTAVAFLDQNTLVYGTKESTKDVIDVYKGKKQALNDPNINTAMSKVNTNSMFLIATRITSTKSAAYGANELIDKANAAAFAIDKAGSNVDVQAAVNFIDSSSAEKTKETLEGYIKLAKGYSESGSATERLLNNVKIRSEGTLIIITLATTTKELEEISKELKSIQPVTTTPPSYENSYDVYSYRGDVNYSGGDFWEENNSDEYSDYQYNYSEYYPEGFNYSDYVVENETD